MIRFRAAALVGVFEVVGFIAAAALISAGVVLSLTTAGRF